MPSTKVGLRTRAPSSPLVIAVGSLRSSPNCRGAEAKINTPRTKLATISRNQFPIMDIAVQFYFLRGFKSSSLSEFE